MLISVFIIFKKINTHTTWEIQSMIRFWNARNIKPVKITERLQNLERNFNEQFHCMRYVQLFNKKCKTVQNNEWRGQTPLITRLKD